jgi:hypothetical protein
MTYTNLEVITYNAIFDVCGTDLGADIIDLIEITGETANVLRGVISSLIKKDMIAVVDDEEATLFAPWNNGVCYCWGGDSLTDEELKLFTELKA